MKHNLMFNSLLLLALGPAALASTTWYVNGVSGSNSNNCQSPTTACKTIGHAIALASSGDSIVVAPATYKENLTISINLNVIGAGENTTVTNGGGRVVTISNANAHVALSNVSIQKGFVRYGRGGGISNVGFLTINNSTISGNGAHIGGGIDNLGTLTINNSTVSANGAYAFCILPYNCVYAYGGGISNSGTATITNSTISGNLAQGGNGGGISIGAGGTVGINNSTISQNSANCNTIPNHCYAGFGGGIWSAGSATFKNSIVANNPSLEGNCNGGTLISHGYNLSSDHTCGFAYGTHDLVDTDPLLGPLQNNGGPTQTMALMPGSPSDRRGQPEWLYRRCGPSAEDRPAGHAASQHGGYSG